MNHCNNPDAIQHCRQVVRLNTKRHRTRQAPPPCSRGLSGLFHDSITVKIVLSHYTDYNNGTGNFMMIKCERLNRWPRRGLRNLYGPLYQLDGLEPSRPSSTPSNQVVGPLVSGLPSTPARSSTSSSRHTMDSPVYTLLPDTPIERVSILLLPPDVLFSIFLQTILFSGIGKELPTTLRLTHVCRYWRNTTHQYASLWTNIQLGPESTKPACLEFILSLTPQSPLQVTAHFGPGKVGDVEVLFLKRCLEEFSRIEKLEWEELPAAYLPSISQSLVAHPNNILRHLMIGNHDTNRMGPLPHVAFPALRLPHLELLQVAKYSLSSIIPLMQPSIKELRLADTRSYSHPSGTWADLLSALNKMPLLEVLSIHHCAHNCDADDIAPVPLLHPHTVDIDELADVLVDLLHLIILPTQPSPITLVRSTERPIEDERVLLKLQDKISSMLINVQDPHTAFVEFTERMFTSLSLEIWSHDHVSSSSAFNHTTNPKSFDFYRYHRPNNPTFAVEYGPMNVVHLAASTGEEGNTHVEILLGICKLTNSLKTLVLHHFPEPLLAFAIQKLFSLEAGDHPHPPPLGLELVLYHVKPLSPNSVVTGLIDEEADSGSLTYALKTVAIATKQSFPLSRLVICQCQGFSLERIERLKQYVKDGNVEWDNVVKDAHVEHTDLRICTSSTSESGWSDLSQSNISLMYQSLYSYSTA
ncbi:hypothetical protein ABKN59_007893 [Abortiporus biennis]